MSEQLQILKVNKSTTYTSVPNLSKFLDKNRKPLVSRPPLIQTKLTINQPGDEYEKEADKVAKQVMRMPEPESVSQSQVNSRPEEMSIQNANRCPKKDIQQKEDDGKEERIIQMKQGSPLHSAGSQPIVPSTIREVLSSPGLPLDPAIRAYMEPRFGHDFSRVRVHSGLAADQSARDVNAQAYTVGHDIVFGAGRLSKMTYEGRRLIAHELMHVVQQRDRGQAIQRQPTSPTVDDLTNAISNHDLGRVQQLISSGVDVNALDKNGMTPLTQATKDGDLQIMELLINNSTKVDGRNNDRETPLIIAATIGNQQAAEILLKNNAWVNAQDLQHRGPLFLSVQNNDLKMVNFFLQNGADVDLTADWGRTSLMEAASKGNQNIMKALIQNGAKVNKEDANNRTALMEAASTGNPKSVKLLLDENADPNKVDKFGRTAIMDASEFGSAQATKELLKAKASVNVQDQDGRTALMEAAKKGKHNIVKVIIQNSNTDVNLKDNKGETALIEAAKSGDVDTLKAILQSKAKVDLNMQDNNGKTALMEAASSGKPGMVKTLVQKTPKPDLNMQDLDGKTALILAVERGDVDGIKTLVQSGAKLDITDKHGNTALSAAQSILFQGGPDTQKNFGEIVRILQKTPHKRIQPFSGQSNGGIDAASANVDQALSSQGRPLEPVVRKDMEQHLGYDFSRVRIHSDAFAEQSARNLNAQAYTIGNDIVFGAGQYAPGTHQGRRMIAHELTHVLQQQGNSDLGQSGQGSESVQSEQTIKKERRPFPISHLLSAALPKVPVTQAKLNIGEPNDKFEQEADRMADIVMRMPDSTLPVTTCSTYTSVYPASSILPHGIECGRSGVALSREARNPTYVHQTIKTSPSSQDDRELARKPLKEEDSKAELEFRSALHFNRTLSGFNPTGSPKEGDFSIIWWKVWNTGWKTAPEHTDRLTIYNADLCSGCRHEKDEIFRMEIPAPSIVSITQQGQSDYENAFMIGMAFSPGHYEAYAELDVHNEVEEINKDNNIAFMVFDVMPRSVSESGE